MKTDFDYLIIGSGFGGSISAYRLIQKGYRVLVVEQGRRFESDDYPKRNWNLRKWLWVPFLRFYGFFRITVFRHVSILAGAGVGGGSLVYANTLPVPRKEFYSSGSWAGLENWESALKPYYEIAAEMLGAVDNPFLGPADLKLKELAEKIGKLDTFEPTRVGVYFGEKDQTVDDPYFDGEGPTRTGCKQCGGCMVGCRFNAKNTLDKNYLYLAEKHGAEVLAKTKVIDVYQNKSEQGYIIKTRRVGSLGLKRETFQAKSVIFAGGVLGTVPLLLKLQRKSLPNLSSTLGRGVRTNNEALIGVVSRRSDLDFTEGVAIGSIVHTDAHSHLEPVRYPARSGFWRILMAPMLSGKTFLGRLSKLIWDYFRHPIDNARAYFAKDWPKRTSILLFMQTLDSKLRFSKGLFGMKSTMDAGKKPSAFIPEAQALAKEYARLVDGKPLVLPTETLFGIPTTAHILGGACMGKTIEEGVIGSDHRVFSYPDLLVVDGSAVSANPGVNPSLTISALAERAMALIPEKEKITSTNQ